MKKIVFVAALLASVSLAGCSTLSLLTGSSVTAQEIIVAGNTFDAIEATATNYLKLPLCPQATVCRTQAASAAIYPAVKSARQARATLEAAVAANPNAALPISNYNVLMTAINTLQSLFAQYGVK